MARNRYDADENSKTKFNTDHLKRTYDYVKRHKRRFISAMMLRGIVSIIPLFTPLITGVAINQGMLGGDIKVFLLCCAAILLINVAVLFLENRTVRNIFFHLFRGCGAVCNGKKTIWNFLLNVKHKLLNAFPFR